MPPRLPPVDADTDDAGLAPVFDRFRQADREVPDLYRVLGNSPAMLRAWTDMAWPLRSEPTTSRALRELIILRVAQLTGATYEWWAHEPAAIRHGVRPEQLTHLHRWQDSGEFDEVERVVLAATGELTEDVAVSEATFARLEEHFGPAEIVELVLTSAFYNCVSRTLRSLGLEPSRD